MILKNNFYTLVHSNLVKILKSLEVELSYNVKNNQKMYNEKIEDRTPRKLCNKYIYLNVESGFTHFHRPFQIIFTH